MKDTEIEQELIRIELILEEADLYGLRNEVKEWALKFLKQDSTLDPITAHELAFDEWVK